MFSIENENSLEAFISESSHASLREDHKLLQQYASVNLFPVDVNMKTWTSSGWLFLLLYKVSAVGVHLLWNDPPSNENTENMKHLCTQCETKWNK